MSRTSPVSARSNISREQVDNLAKQTVTKQLALAAVKPMLAAAAKQVAANVNKVNSAVKGNNNK
jgi:hypothetical protein